MPEKNVCDIFVRPNAAMAVDLRIARSMKYIYFLNRDHFVPAWTLKTLNAEAVSLASGERTRSGTREVQSNFSENLQKPPDVSIPGSTPQVNCVFRYSS